MRMGIGILAMAVVIGTVGLTQAVEVMCADECAMLSNRQ